jgi:hypothetical protein
LRFNPHVICYSEVMSEKKSDIIQHKKDSQLLELLETIDYMESYNDAVINKSKLNTSRRTLALATYTAVTQYAAGIKIMLDSKPMSKVAEPLIRSMFEAWINLEYMLLGDDDRNVLINIWDNLHPQKARMERVQQFFEKHDLEEISGLTLAKVKLMVDSKTQEINEIEKSFKSKGFSDLAASKLYEKAELVDNAKGFDEPGYSVYYNYQLMYGHWSAGVHLGYDGLLTWLDIDGQNIKFNSNETIEDVKRILWTAIALLKDVSILAIRELDLYDEEYDNKIQEIVERNK